jgi:3-oxoacyl-(acyl-carrier-protein) synthase
MDAAELEAARRLFGAPPPELLVKPAIGEMAAAGGGQLVAACLALGDTAAPLAGPGPRRALVNSFGAGGNFLAAVLEAPEA